MTKGILVFAKNNNSINYVNQAKFLAKQSQKYLDLPVSIVTDNPIDNNVWFDKVILYDNYAKQYKKYNDGHLEGKVDYFFNSARQFAFELSPYDQTLMLDTDIIIMNDKYLQCFEQSDDFLIYHDAVDIANSRDYYEFTYISEESIKFYWATAVYFTKSKKNQIFFNLLQHIYENWNHYSLMFKIKQKYFRNDHAFSIAIHLLNSYTNSSVKSMPGKLFYTIDKDICVSINENKIFLLLEKSNEPINYYPVSVGNLNLHIMNKFSLDKCIANMI